MKKVNVFFLLPENQIGSASACDRLRRLLSLHIDRVTYARLLYIEQFSTKDGCISERKQSPNIGRGENGSESRNGIADQDVSAPRERR